MRALQKIGGAGALLLGVSFVLLIVSNAVIKPGLGINGPADEANPAKFLPVASSLSIWYSIPILFAIAFTLVALALNDRLGENSPTLMRIATASGLGASVLFLAGGMFNFLGLPLLGSFYSQNPAAVTPSILVLAGGIADSLLTAGIFASGWFVILASWAALQGGLPKILNYVGILFGLAGILAFLIPPLSLIGAVLGIVWSLWLGVALLREPERMAAPAMSRA